MSVSLIVVGGLNTDLIASGVKRFPKPGEHVYGERLIIGPGGKSRNIAAMAANLMPAGSVAMVGRTAKDAHGLWKIPLDALALAGVDTAQTVIDEHSGRLPGIALIAVDQAGQNQIIVLPGANNDFSPADIDSAKPLFDSVRSSGGYLAVTLECPVDTAAYAIHAAKGIKVVFDPGGITPEMQIKDSLKGIFLIKPNEHEAHTLTGVRVTDMAGAKQAAYQLMGMGVENVMITVGKNGAYLFTQHSQDHIAVPDVTSSGSGDETGCGDQAMATICAYLHRGSSLSEAAMMAVLAGTLQFHRSGVQPITQSELESSTLGYLG